MNILISTDNNYVMPTGVLMNSISTHNESVHYYILTDKNLSNSNKEKLIATAKSYGNDIDILVVNSTKLCHLPIGSKNQPKHITEATYYRLFIVDLLPKSIHRILYLDGDIIVRKKLDDYYNQNLDNYSVCVSHDVDEEWHKDSRRLPYPMYNGYFNAGVLLINLDYWRTNDLTKKFVYFVINHENLLLFHDQDVLNTVLYDSIKWMPITYNFQSNFVYLPKWTNFSTKVKTEIDNTVSDPAIIHYITKRKPWNLFNGNPYSYIWRYYWKKSLWENNKLTFNKVHNLKDFLGIIAYATKLHCLQYKFRKNLPSLEY